MKMPWAETIFDATRNLSVVRCKVCTKIEIKHNFLNPKWDSLEKQTGKRKNEERVKVVDVMCAHAQNETNLVSMNRPSILEQVQSGFEGENKRKVIYLFRYSCFLPKKSP
jgi:hypothetical protein